MGAHLALTPRHRQAIEDEIEFLIALLDLRDLPDVEDEPDFSPRRDGLPGTTEDTEPTDEAGDLSWSERSSRTGWQDCPAFIASEDQEDGADAEAGSWAELGTADKAGFYAEGENEDDGWHELRRAQRDRIRRTRCIVTRDRYGAEYRLPEGQPAVTFGDGRAL